MLLNMVTIYSIGLLWLYTSSITGTDKFTLSELLAPYSISQTQAKNLAR